MVLENLETESDGEIKAQEDKYMNARNAFQSSPRHRYLGQAIQQSSLQIAIYPAYNKSNKSNN